MSVGDRKLGLAKVRAKPGIDAFFDPEPRLALMKDMGIDRTLLWPTLATVLEGRLANDPDVAVAVIHALNEWMHEHWSFVYSGAIYSTPIVSLAAGTERAIEELEWVHERGAKIFLLRVAPVPTWRGAIPSPCLSWIHSGPRCKSSTWWWVCTPAKTTTASATSTSGTASAQIRCPSPTPAAPRSPRWLERSVVQDGVASIIGHGLATRFPTLKFMPVEFQASWIRPFVQRIRAAYEETPVLFDEDPFEVFCRNIYVNAFHEPDPQGLLDLGIPADRLMFGSDFPHPEGMADPLLLRSGRKSPLRHSGADHGRLSRESPQGRCLRPLIPSTIWAATPAEGRERTLRQPLASS